jgi:parallel beta-helix repeat protein
VQFVRHLTAAIVVIFAAATLLAPRASSAAATTLKPSAYLTTAGTDGGQPVGNLVVQDQSGTQNDWNKYVEFIPAAGGTYAGYRTYTLPADIAPGAITAIQIKANYLGPLKSTQIWSWKLYNWSTGAWVAVGDNAAAAEWSWSALTFSAAGTLASYVKSDTRQIRVQLVSNNASDSADLDYEALVITSGAPTSTPVSTSAATATSTPTATRTSTPTPTAVSTATPTGAPSATPTPGAGPAYYVATTGSDSNPGTQAAPWRTIQKAANSATPGSTVYVRGGVYTERVTVNVSGSAAGGPITFQNYPGETPVVDGTGLSVPASENGLFLLIDRSYVVIKGFEIRNYKTATSGLVPVGIHVRGASHHIELRNNYVHHIETNYTGKDGGDAHGIAVYGDNETSSLNNVIIDNNELANLKLGSSEALVVNGNVEQFQVTNNRVHDSNNIGIDAIGFEPVAPNSQARSGVISGNTVYNITSYGNPAYGTDRSADGIYVDGGTNITIERNLVYNTDIGIELASEHAGKSTSFITVRNNIVRGSLVVGISIGGYDTQRGSTQNCVIVNNTLFQNDTTQSGTGELNLQYDTRNNTIKNNIFYANAQNLFISNGFTQNTGNLVDSNIYYAPGGATGSTWNWKNVEYTSFAAYRQATGNDAHSLFANPLFVSLTAPDLHLQTGSPAVNAGESLAAAGSLDFDGQARVQGGLIDIGADEAR